MANAFSVGDAVVCIVDRPIGNAEIMSGDIGTVVFTNPTVTGVDWGRFVGGHSCHGRCPNGNGWNVETKTLKLLEPDISFDIKPSDIESLFQEVIT